MMDAETTKRAGGSSLLLSAVLGFSAVWVGIAEAAVQAAVAHVTRRTHQLLVGERRAGAPSEAPPVRMVTTVASYESVQRQVAEMRARVDAARALVDKLAASIDALMPNGASPVPWERMDELRGLMYSCRTVAGEAAVDVCRIALRVCGLRGLMRGHPLERHMRDALTAQVMAPGEDLVKVRLGRQVLGLHERVDPNRRG
jgi:alkylation response protein AidB-like acyl-CoA dehydrogenase